MKIKSSYAESTEDVSDFFAEVFAASEGPDAGHSIRAFVHDLMETTPHRDLVACAAYDDARLVGGIFFSRVVFDQDPRQVFILSPLAVATDCQKSGIGRHLIAFGLETLRRNGVDVALTYGDPAYYRQTGFQPVSERFAPPPMKLSHPHGWLGQPLSDAAFDPLLGASRCVDALCKPELW